MKRTLTILSLTSLIILATAVMANAQPVNIYTCAELHGDPGCAPSPFAGLLVEQSGYVYVIPGIYNGGSVYWQCSGSGGMTLFDTALDGALDIGTCVVITGNVDAFGDEIQLINTQVQIVGAGPVTPISIGTADLADGTDQLGNFMCVEGLLAETSVGFNSLFTVDDGTGPVIVFVDGTTGIDVTLMQSYVGDIVRICGSTKCFDGVGEILPRFDSDITLVAVPNENASWGTLKTQFDEE